MGNHAKRRQLARLVKERGFGRLYRSVSKRVAWRRLRASRVEQMILYFTRQPGDLVNDCTCFNHVIKKYMVERYKGIVKARRYEFEDGLWSCGCPWGPEPAKSREEIEKTMLEYWTDRPDFAERANEDFEKLRRGEHICDERGIRLRN